MRFSPLMSKLIDTALAAGNVVLQSYRATVTVEYKGPDDPVTSADRASNALICEALRSEYPDYPIVAEESDPNTFGDYRTAESVFFVDPIDGTREFLDRTDEFVVMIGLVRGSRAVAGVIHAPANGIVWAGEVGVAAYQFTAGSPKKPIKPSRTECLTDSHILISRAHRSKRLTQNLLAIGPRLVRSVGSAGLKGALVAEGQADAYLAPGMAGKRWDACALDALVTAAGGRVTDAEGAPIDYRSTSLENDRGLVASNGALHEQLIAKLSD